MPFFFKKNERLLNGSAYNKNAKNRTPTKYLMNKTKPQSNKFVFYASIATATFLLLLYLNTTYFKLDFVLIGVVQEMLTLPAMFAQPVLMLMAGRAFDLNGYKIKSYSFFAILISLTTFLIVVSSFI